ncbi:MAG: RDD domain-containing protein [Parcubacteria group bacterium GW2011_GWA2_49_16]|nr:MAG: RDD domain-containing protein [Parcubacteria group bacterium GW2011_GWA2_49_16]
MPQAQVPQIGYAGFWLRFLAYTLDSLIIFVIIGIPINIIASIVDSRSILFAVGITLLHIVLMYTYFIFLTNKNQATIGKKLLGLRVVSEEGTPLSLGKIAFRETIGKLISAVILFIGYLMVAFTSKKQGLHDKMVGSVVLSNPAERKTWAFVVSIILSAVLPIIAIIGILAAITLASLSSAREYATDAIIKSNLISIQAQAEVVYYANNKSYGTMLADPIIKEALKKAIATARANPTGNVTTDAYAVYLPLKNPTAPNTGWCVDSTGASRASVDPGMATVCP